MKWLLWTSVTVEQTECVCPCHSGLGFFSVCFFCVVDERNFGVLFCMKEIRPVLFFFFLSCPAFSCPMRYFVCGFLVQTCIVFGKVHRHSTSINTYLYTYMRCKLLNPMEIDDSAAIVAQEKCEGGCGFEEIWPWLIAFSTHGTGLVGDTASGVNIILEYRTWSHDASFTVTLSL